MNLDIGQRVEALYSGIGDSGDFVAARNKNMKWFKGTVVGRSNGSYDIAYDCGDSEEKLHARFVRAETSETSETDILKKIQRAELIQEFFGNLFDNLENNLQELYLKVVEYLDHNPTQLYNFRPDGIYFSHTPNTKSTNNAAVFGTLNTQSKSNNQHQYGKYRYTEIKIHILYDIKGYVKRKYVDNEIGYQNFHYGPTTYSKWLKMYTLFEITTKRQIINSNFKIHKVGGYLLYCEKSQIEELFLNVNRLRVEGRKAEQKALKAEQKAWDIKAAKKAAKKAKAEARKKAIKKFLKFW